jgi:hypothetical protein
MIERRPSLNFQQANAMNPIEKYEKLGRFPYKMIVHILLVVFTTCQVVLIVSEANKYSRSQERFLYNMFVDEGDKRSVDFNRIAYLYSVDDVKKHVATSVQNFYTLNTKSLEIVQFTSGSPYLAMEVNYIDNSKVEQSIQSLNGEDFNKIKELNVTGLTGNDADVNTANQPFIKKNVIPRKFYYKITNETLGPFGYSNEDLKEFLNDVVDFKLNYTLKTYVPYYYNNNYDCNYWSVNQIYSFATRGHLVVKLNIIKLACEDYLGNHTFLDIFINKLLWIHIIVFILAFLSLYMTWDYIQSIASLYMRVKSKHKQKKMKENEDATYSKSEDSIYYNPLLDEDLRKQQEDEIKKAKNAKMKSIDEYYDTNNGNDNSTRIHKVSDDRSRYHFNIKNNDQKVGPSESVNKLQFNSWSLVCLIGNVLQVFGAGISVFDTDNILTSSEILIGFGCMFAFLNIGRYLEYAENYSTIYVTIKNSLPNVCRYLIGVLPIFLGFIFFGLCIFWRSERFTDTSNVMMILFALAQGDSVYDSFKDLSGVYFFLGQVYLYMFCIMFIVVVLNIFIAIIEEAYITSKMESKTHWVFDYIKKDKKQNITFKPPTAHEDRSRSKSPVESKLIRPKSSKELISVSKKSTVPQRKKQYIEEHSVPSSTYFKDDRRFSHQADYIVENESEQQQYEKMIEEEFNAIDNELREILQLSLEVKVLNDEQLTDEMRLLVLERINTSVLNKTQEIRSLLNKYSD